MGESVELLRQLWDPTTLPSNIPLFIKMSKMCFWTIPFPLHFNGKFKLCTTKWQFFAWISTTSTMILHLGLTLLWFINYASGSLQVPDWKAVMMTFVFFIFIMDCLFLFQMADQQQEIVALLNSSIEIEQNCQRRGAKAYVHRYFVIIMALTQISVILTPVSITLVNLFRPCIPPFLSSEVFLTCKSWEDFGDGLSVLSRILLALVAGYTWGAAAAVSCYPIAAMMVYPVEVTLLFLNSLEREIRAGRFEVVDRYRIIQVLTGLQNYIWQKQAMPGVLITVTVIEATVCFILMTSARQLPFPVVVFFSIVAIDAGVVIQVVFKIMSYPLSTSTGCLNLINQAKPSKLALKYRKSCPPLKIYMGGGRYYDGLTSFVIWDQTVELLIRFLLM